MGDENFVSCTLLKVIGTWRGWFAENPLQNKNFVFNQFMPLTLQLFRVWKYISGWNCWDTMQKSVNITLTQILDGYVHPRPPSSIHLHPAYFNLQPVPPSSFQPPVSSLQHPQQYLNQNIARNWTISSNLDQKIKSRSFWLKIGSYGTLEVLTPNSDLDFGNFDPKIHFWANLDPKVKVVRFNWKLANMISWGWGFLFQR